MKIFTAPVRRLACSPLLAGPFCWLASAGLPGAALVGYVVAIAAYWLIQVFTEFRRPSDGLLVLGFLSVLYALLLPGLAMAHTRSTLVSPVTVRRVADSQTVMPGDHLLIVVKNRECPDFRERVDASGDISMPWAGKLRVAGKTLRQAEESIETAYGPSCFREPIRVSISRL